MPLESASKDYFVLFPGAGLAERCWPTSSFREIAKRIHDATGWICVICGGAGEEHLGEIIGDGTIFPLNTLIGRTSLPELVAIISGARLLVGNETSAIHIAAAVQTPSLCLLGGGHFGRFIPYTLDEPFDFVGPLAVFHEMGCYHCNWLCSQKFAKGAPFPCLAQITVEQVWEVTRAMIDAESGTQ